MPLCRNKGTSCKDFVNNQILLILRNENLLQTKDGELILQYYKANKNVDDTVFKTKFYSNLEIKICSQQ